MKASCTLSQHHIYRFKFCLHSTEDITCHGQFCGGKSACSRHLVNQGTWRRYIVEGIVHDGDIEFIGLDGHAASTRPLHMNLPTLVQRTPVGCGHNCSSSKIRSLSLAASSKSKFFAATCIADLSSLSKSSIWAGERLRASDGSSYAN